MITTTLTAKPHVASFIQAYFRRDLMDGTVAKIPKNISALYNAVGHYSTIHFHDRITQAPDGMVLFKAALPKPYESHYLSQRGAGEFGKSLEDFFWREFKEYILMHMHEYNLYKDHVIMQFMDQYKITESLYPIGHFRRQCTRMKIRGLKQPIPMIRERLHRRISDQLCMQMYRIYRDRKVSAKVIGEHYGLSKYAVHRIFKKIHHQKNKEVA